MKGDFANRGVLLTGASSGIGRALALRLASRGARLALVARGESTLEAVAEQCRRIGAPCAISLPFDLTRLDDVAALVRQAEREAKGDIDMLIHAAAQSVVGFVEDVPVEVVRDCFTTNVLAAAALAGAVIPAMKARRAGRLVFLISGVAHRGVPTETAYSASKAALLRLAEGLEAELRDHGVKVTIVSPGPTDTPMFRSPRRYGTAPLIGRTSTVASADFVADRILRRLETGASRVELSWRGMAARHLNYWAPELLDWLLRRHLQR